MIEKKRFLLLKLILFLNWQAIKIINLLLLLFISDGKVDK